jgi:hypothetical protein
MPKILIAIVSLCGFMLFATSYAEEVHIVPDRFQIVGYNNVPRVSIKELNDGYEIKVKFEASREALVEFLARNYGEKFDDLDIYEYDLKPINFQFLSETFENSSVLKKISKDYATNRIYLNILTNKDYNQTQLKHLLLFGVVFGALDAEIVCAGSLVTDLCGKTIKRIPVFNQYKLTENKKLEQSFYDYLALNQYLAFLKIRNLALEEKDLDNSVKRALFRTNGTRQVCNQNNPAFEMNVCKIISNHSPTNQITEALSVLGKKVYPEKLIEDNYDYYIFQSSAINVKRLNLGIDFEELRKKLNQQLTIKTGGTINADLPMVTHSEIDTQLQAAFPKDSLRWEDTKIVGIDTVNFKGYSEIRLTNLFTGDWVVPVSYQLIIAFTYDVPTKQVEIQKFMMLDPKFLATGGFMASMAKQYKKTITDLVNGHLNSSDIKERAKEMILEEIQEIQQEGIAIFAL